MTYPLIGNYGRLRRRRPVDAPVAPRRSSWPTRRRPSSTTPASSRRSCADDGIPAIAGVDTRALARHLRANGSLRGIVTAPGEIDAAAAVAAARAVPRWEDQDFVGQVSPAAVARDRGPGEGGPLVAIVDFGLKANIVRSLRRRGARVRVLPAHGDAPRMSSPPTSTGVVLSPGPGRSGAARRPVALARAIIDDGRPLLGHLPRPPDRRPRRRAPRRAGCGSGTTGRTTRSRTSTRARCR